MNNNNSKKSNTVTIIAIVVILVLLLCCAGGGLTTVFVYNGVSKNLDQKLVDDTDIIDDTDFIADTDVIADTDIIDDTDDIDIIDDIDDVEKEIDDIEVNKESNLDSDGVALLNGDNLIVKMDLSTVEVAKKNEEKRVRFTIDAENKGAEAINVEFEDIIINDESDVINVSIDILQLGSAAEYDGKANFDYNKDIELILDDKYNNEEVENIKFRFKTYDPETYETIFKTSYCELDLSNNESVATLITEATEQEDNEDGCIKEDTETALYGTEKVGYVTLDGVWADFDDVDIANSEQGDMVQYTNGDVIVTLNVAKNGDPENSIKNLAALEEGTRTKIDIGKYDTDLMDAHYVYQEYDDGYKLYITCFTSDLTKDEEDMIYLAIESPLQSEDEFVETVNNIQESHSYGYFYDFFSLSNRDS